MYWDNTFEILAVKDNSLFKGPCLTYRRDSHASIIIKNYLYIFSLVVLKKETKQQCHMKKLKYLLLITN